MTRAFKIVIIVTFQPVGSVAEWSKALVLGTSHVNGVGSNPTAAINFFFLFPFSASFLFLLSIFMKKLFYAKILLSSKLVLPTIIVLFLFFRPLSYTDARDPTSE